jgi:Cyclic nucleotide-binding domain
VNSLTFSIGRLTFSCKVAARRPRMGRVRRDQPGRRPHSTARPDTTAGPANPAELRQVMVPAPRSASVSFWESLDATEREALRSVASWGTFAAGARIMQEGDRADHVMVILGGRAKICVNKNGREHVLAVRGLGQLVGERGALEVSVRSATVVALDMVWALVVETKDFAAFITAHPRVLAIVQDQCNDRGTTGLWAAADQSGHDNVAGHSWPRRQALNGENCTVCLSDVVEFGARTRNDQDRLIIREALSAMTETALWGMPGVWSEDRGDGLLTVIPPLVSTGLVLQRLLRELPAALEAHNRTHRAAARFRLRLAVNVGPVVSDTIGVSGEAIIVVARLVEAPGFKAAISQSRATFSVIASPFVYETVIRHAAEPGDVASYSPVRVEVKESRTTAWMKLFTEETPSWVGPRPAAAEPHLDPLMR